MTDEYSEIESVIIIGGGPAGLAAATYNARAGLCPLLIAGSPPGGQLTLTSEVENYPGFESILGPELVQKMREQATKFGTRIIDANVIKVDFSRRPFKIYFPESTKIFPQVNSSSDVPSEPLSRLQKGSVGIADSNIHSRQNFVSSSSVLIATGAKALWLGLESETRLRGKGVSACATCDGFFFKGKTVAVVGGGDTALEEALTLTKFASKVYIIHRRNEFRASKIMQERVLKHPKIKIIYNTIVEEIMGSTKVEGVRLRINQKRSEVGKIRNRNNSDKSENSDVSGLSDVSGIRLPISSDSSGLSEIQLDGVFIAIGHKPDTELFSKQIGLDEKGYIITAQSKSLEIATLLNGQIVNKNNLTMKPFDVAQGKQFNNFGFQSATSVPGVFAAGDCVDHVYRQAATAVGMGVAAALEVERWLNKI